MPTLPNLCICEKLDYKYLTHYGIFGCITERIGSLNYQNWYSKLETRTIAVTRLILLTFQNKIFNCFL